MAKEAEEYGVGQSWIYEAPKGFDNSRIIVGAILTFSSHEPVICACVTSAPLKNSEGEVRPLTIPFLPFSKTAFDQTVMEKDGMAELPAGFMDNYKSWKTDARGLGFINIPFKDLLRNMADGLEQQQQAMQQKAGKIACIEKQ